MAHLEALGVCGSLPDVNWLVHRFCSSFGAPVCGRDSSPSPLWHGGESARLVASPCLRGVLVRRGRAVPCVPAMLSWLFASSPPSLPFPLGGGHPPPPSLPFPL
eukprot:353037-Chlamydomonas_euryale.AAC.1